MNYFLKSDLGLFIFFHRGANMYANSRHYHLRRRKTVNTKVISGLTDYDVAPTNFRLKTFRNILVKKSPHAAGNSEPCSEILLLACVNTFKFTRAMVFALCLNGKVLKSS